MFPLDLTEGRQKEGRGEGKRAIKRSHRWSIYTTITTILIIIIFPLHLPRIGASSPSFLPEEEEEEEEDKGSHNTGDRIAQQWDFKGGVLIARVTSVKS